MTHALDKLTRAWARIGGGFTAAPAPQTPHLERLLLDTARLIPHEPRLFAIAGSWLCQYFELVAKQRLAALVEDELEVDARSVLGLLLDAVGQHIVSDHFSKVIGLCNPAAIAQPLYHFQRGNTALRQLAQRRASDVSRHWNLWTEPLEPKRDAIRPAIWVFQHNLTYRLRETLAGDLRASIIETLRETPDAGRSELELCRRLHASRDAIRKALDRLERYGHIERVPHGRALGVRWAA